MQNGISNDLVSLKKILPASLSEMALNIESTFSELDGDLRDAQEEIEVLQSEIEALENNATGFDNIVDAGIGLIEWKSDNMSLQMVMASLDIALHERSANEVIDVLDLMAKKSR